MTKKSTKSLLALLLTFILVATLVLGTLPVAAADTPVLQNGEAVIAADADAAAINAALSKALLANYDSVGNVEWEYSATNTYNTYFYETISNNYLPFPATEQVWVAVGGATVTARIDDGKFLGKTYAQSGDVQFAPITSADDGTVFDVRIAGTEETVQFTLRKDGTAPVVTPDPEPDPEPDPDPEPAAKAVVVNTGETYPVAIAFNDDLSWNYTAIAQNIIDAVAPGLGLTPADVTVKNVGTFSEYDLAGGFAGVGKLGAGNNTVHMTFAGNDKVEPFDLKVKVNVSDQRMQPVIVLKEEAAVTYNKDGLRPGIYADAIDHDASTLPAGVTADSFKMEYKNLLVFWNDIGRLDVGDYTVRITLPETAQYKSASVEGDLKVEKANVTVTVRPATIYPEEALPENFVTTNPEDDFTIFMLYAGVSTDLAPALYIQFPSSTVGDALMKGIDTVYAFFNDGKTFTQRLNEGVTVGELREILVSLAGYLKDGVENPVVKAVIDGVLSDTGFDSDTILSFLTAIENLPGVFDNWAVAIGVPGRAGTYAAAAIALNKNYNTGFGIGLLIVKQHFFGTKLVWNQTPDGAISAADAANFDYRAHAEYKGTVLGGQTVKYSFTGFTSSGRLYISSTAPTEPGRYLCTAYTFGGNFLALPITRLITITA